jgi:hypothetical protein
MEPDDRDLAALLFAWQCRRVTPAQLRRAFYADLAPTTGPRRLARLVDEGLMENFGTPEGHRRPLLAATRAGRSLLALYGLLPKEWVPEEASPAPGPSLDHDLAVVDLRLAFEESGADGRTWISDHELRRSRRRPGAWGRIPDALFDFEWRDASGQGILEYEHKAYSRRQRAGMLAHLRVLHPRRTLFIVSQTSVASEAFRSWAATSPLAPLNRALLAFAAYADAAALGLKAGWRDVDGAAWTPGAATRQGLNPDSSYKA